VRTGSAIAAGRFGRASARVIEDAKLLQCIGAAVVGGREGCLEKVEGHRLLSGLAMQHPCPSGSSAQVAAGAHPRQTTTEKQTLPPEEAPLPKAMALKAAEWRKLPVSLAELCINTSLRCGQSFRYIRLYTTCTAAAVACIQ